MRTYTPVEKARKKKKAATSHFPSIYPPSQLLYPSSCNTSLWWWIFSLSLSLSVPSKKESTIHSRSGWWERERERGGSPVGTFFFFFYFSSPFHFLLLLLLLLLSYTFTPQLGRVTPVGLQTLGRLYARAPDRSSSHPPSSF